jgi:transcriptional regulator with XRE-family HTH domain
LSLEAKNERIAKVWQAYRLRTQDGLSQREIATKLGVSRAWVANWLNGVPRVRDMT